jgi:cytosine/adenosine deaminase-related metal-dependent hydrolase
MTGSTTILRGGYVWLGGAEVERTDVVISDGQIAAITRDFRGATDLVLDARDCVVLPGLINSHVHPGGTPILRGIAEDLPLPAPGALYHNTVDFRLISWKHLTDDEIVSLVEWEAVAMLLGGATTIISEQVGDLDQWIAVCDRPDSGQTSGGSTHTRPTSPTAPRCRAKLSTRCSTASIARSSSTTGTTTRSTVG